MANKFARKKRRQELVTAIKKHRLGLTQEERIRLAKAIVEASEWAEQFNIAPAGNVVGALKGGYGTELMKALKGSVHFACVRVFLAWAILSYRLYPSDSEKVNPLLFAQDAEITPDEVRIMKAQIAFLLATQ